MQNTKTNFQETWGIIIFQTMEQRGSNIHSSSPGRLNSEYCVFGGLGGGVLQTTRWNLINPCFYPAQLGLGDWQTKQTGKHLSSPLPLSSRWLSPSVPECPPASQQFYILNRNLLMEKTTPAQPCPAQLTTERLLLASVNWESEQQNTTELGLQECPRLTVPSQPGGHTEAICLSLHISIWYIIYVCFVSMIFIIFPNMK